MSTLIYHITHLRNLRSILEAGELLCNQRIKRSRTQFQDISYGNIQDRRSRIQVPFGSQGRLHEYVPFYFAPRSPMLYTINKGNVAGCPEGQTSIIHLVTTAEAFASARIEFCFTDGHAAMVYSDFFNNLADLNQIDWGIMQEKYWRDTDEDGDRKRRRQAEFLVYQTVPWNLITSIGVINSTIQQQVQRILQDMNQSTPTQVRPDWYYLKY
ncbi:MAG: DUF4433 domain-containing protein [Cyanothece sp. SIO2G6]|nr:DUF4433 domain-containing protein [Cyanothece sp. SIO2G6]